MEPENNNQEVLQTNQASQPSRLHQITPLSKYLAMILFVALPFIGGWVGYMYTPEKVVEVEKNTEAEKVAPQPDSVIAENITQSLGMGSDIATRVIIDTPSLESLESDTQGSFLDMEKYSFQNGLYSVSFNMNKYVTFSDSYSDPTTGNLGKGMYQGIFSVVTYNEEVVPPTSTTKTLFLISVFSKDYCHLSLCEYETKSKVSLNGNEWEFIGPTQYCDAGYCGGYNYVYRRALGAYVVYLKSAEDLTSEDLNENISQVIDSLSINLINR